MGLRIAIVATIWVVGGCSASGGGRSLQPDIVQATEVPAASSSGRPASIDLPPSVLDPVVAEIAKVAGVPIDQVTIVTAESVTFPDGSLGCPIRGMVYTQVLVDGYRIVAEAGGTTYDYRGTAPGTFHGCMTRN